MTRILTGLAVLLVLSPVFAQKQETVVGSGKITTETRKLAEFDEIDLRIRGNAYVTIGKPTPLEITGDDNLLPLIKTEVHERRLVISAEHNFKTKQAPNLKITVANLEAASIAGSGDVHGFDLTAGNATVTISGSGDAKVNVTRALSIQIRGSGDVHYKGNPTVSKQVSGSGDVKRRD